MSRILNIWFTINSCFTQFTFLAGLAETVLTVTLRRGKMPNSGSGTAEDSLLWDANLSTSSCGSAKGVIINGRHTASNEADCLLAANMTGSANIRLGRPTKTVEVLA